ncbi:hypothetical protein BGZ95_007859, partial [Linnemannia exigua]
MINPAFSYKYIKEMVPSIAGSSEILSKMWERRVETAEGKSIEMDVVPDLSACTLDIIGLVGFGFDMEALGRPSNNVADAYNEYFSSKTPAFLQFCRHYVPYYTKLPVKHNRDRMRSFQSIDGIAHQIIREKRAQAAVSVKGDYGKDIISILIRASEESSENCTLSDEDLKAQMRQEMLDHIGRPTDNNTKTILSYDSLHALPYLNLCIKELLRVIPPLHTTSRVASQDDVILGYHIPKGTEIYLSPAALHKLKSVWGEDAE